MITFPAWLLWFVPVLVGFALCMTADRRGAGPMGWGPMYPSAKHMLGIALLIATALVGAGFLLARWLR